MVLVVVVVLVLPVVVRALVAARSQNVREHAEGRHQRQIEEQLVPRRLVLLPIELFLILVEGHRRRVGPVDDLEHPHVALARIKFRGVGIKNGVVVLLDLLSKPLSPTGCI